MAGFESHIEKAAAAIGELPETVRAKMVGRWPNGAPLVLYPHGQPASADLLARDEEFLFGRDDPRGLASPVRRPHPTGQSGETSSIPVAPTADEDHHPPIASPPRPRLRGWRRLLGGCAGPALYGFVNADTSNGSSSFFLQQTLIGSTFFGRLRNEADPIAPRRTRLEPLAIPTLEGTARCTGLPSFVSVIGGGYFFLPGRQALNFLSS